MKKIASFTVNHNILQPGVYVSRVDGDAVTYDLRMKKPNAGSYITPKSLHTIEHLLATYVRNSSYTDQVIYAGPMGCRTGFYLIMRDSVSKAEVLSLQPRPSLLPVQVLRQPLLSSSLLTLPFLLPYYPLLMVSPVL